MKGYFPLVSYAVQSKGPVLSGLRLDNGIALVGAYIKESGYKPVIFDYNNTYAIESINKLGKEVFLEGVIDQLDDFISQTDSKIIGFKLYNNGFKDVVKIAEELKKRNQKLVTVAGGPQVKWFRESIFEYTNGFDILSYGEGDYVIGKIADIVHENKGDINKIPKIVFSSNGGFKKSESTESDHIEFGSMLYPLYEDKVYLNKDGKIQIPVIEDSRGCSHKCSFCVHPRISGKKRTRDVDEVIKEMDFFNQEYGFRVFRLSGSSPPPEYINRLVEKMSSDYVISCFGRGDPVYDYSGLRDNFLGVFIGLESADSDILKELNKTDDVEPYLDGVRNTVIKFKEQGVCTVTSMIIPSPNENEESLQRNLEFLSEIRPDFVPALPIAPMPGSVLTKRIKKGTAKGIRIDDDYTKKMMLLEFDNLQPSNMWPPVPWDVVFNGEWVDNPFSITQKFIDDLESEGMRPCNDDIVLMTYLHNNGLSRDQSERREQCLDFMKTAKKNIMENPDGITKMVKKINRNQGIENV